MEVKEGKRFERHSICVWVRARTLDKHALNLLDPEFEHVHFLKLIWRGWVFVFLLDHTILLSFTVTLTQSAPSTTSMAAPSPLSSST